MSKTVVKDKLPIYESFFSCDETEGIDKERGKKWRTVFKTFLIVFMIISLAFFTFAFWSWRHNDNTKAKVIIIGKEKGNVAKQPFDPPPHTELAETARYIAHYMDWAVVSTISVHYGGIPAGTPLSVSDGPVNNSTGVPYIYVTSFSPITEDMKKNPEASFTFSEAQSDYCTKNKLDPEDPQCAQLILLGELVQLSPEEIPFAKKALFSRHPEMKNWPSSHHFYFAKLNISHVNLLDYFGPDHDIPLKDYFAAHVQKAA